MVAKATKRMKPGKRRPASRHHLNSKALRDLKFGDLDQVMGGLSTERPLPPPAANKDDKRRE